MPTLIRIDTKKKETIDSTISETLFPNLFRNDEYLINYKSSYTIYDCTV